MRDKLAERARQFNDDTGAQSAISQIAVGTILTVVSLVVALTILPTLTSSVATAQADGNLSATASTLLGLLPTVVVVGLLISGIGFMIGGIRKLR